MAAISHLARRPRDADVRTDRVAQDVFPRLDGGPKLTPGSVHLFAPSWWGCVRKGFTPKGSGEDSAKTVRVVLGRNTRRIPVSYITFGVARREICNGELTQKQPLEHRLVPRDA